MLSTLQHLMFIMFVLTIVLVLLAEFGTDIRFKRAMALASIATVSTAIVALVRDPPKAGDWPTMTWELQGKPAKKKQTRTAYVSTADDDGPDDVNQVVEEKKTRFAEGDTASERLEHMFVMAFTSPRDLGPSAGDKVRDCEACPELLLVPAGVSRVGGDAGDGLTMRAELPQTVVRIWPGFMLSRSEVTEAEYGAFTRATGRAIRTCPAADDTAGSALASCVNQDDALAYVAWLRLVTGKTYRLPSASEWEYAARAEQAGWAEQAGAPGLSSSGQPIVSRPVVSRVAISAVVADHPWGLHGLGGGLAERTADCWDDDLSRLPSNGEAFVPHDRCGRNVLKDGAASELPIWARPSARRPIDTRAASARVGFRVVRSIK